GDSSIGMNLAALQLEGSKLRIDPLRDVNQSAAIVYQAKKKTGRSGVFILGGGSSKNFMLQTEPQIQEVLGLEEAGHDYFLQVTDARPDTGGLSGATPHEAMTWGKVDPDMLPETVTCYLDSLLNHLNILHADRQPDQAVADPLAPFLGGADITVRRRAGMAERRGRVAQRRTERDARGLAHEAVDAGATPFHFDAEHVAE